MTTKTLKHRWNKAINGQPITIEIHISEVKGVVSYWIEINGCQETSKIKGIPNIKGFDSQGQPIKKEVQ